MSRSFPGTGASNPTYAIWKLTTRHGDTNIRKITTKPTLTLKIIHLLDKTGKITYLAMQRYRANATLNRKVLTLHLKTARLCSLRMCHGKAFHNLGAAIANALSPSVGNILPLG